MRLVASILLTLATVCVCPAEPPAILLPDASLPVSASSPEGTWRFGADGAIFEVKAAGGVDGFFELVLEESPDLSLPAGTPFGNMKWTGTGRNYEASLLGDPAGGKRSLTPHKMHHFILTLSDDGTTLTFKPYKRGKRVNILRWLPYLVRLSVTDTDTRQREVDAATRIDPTSTPTTITI